MTLGERYLWNFRDDLVDVVYRLVSVDHRLRKLA